MNYSQIASIIGAVGAIAVAIAGGFLGWLAPAEALGLALAGLSLLGVHTGGSVAGAKAARGY